MLCRFVARYRVWLCPVCGVALPRREGEPPPRLVCAGVLRPRPAPRRRSVPPPAERILAHHAALPRPPCDRAEVRRRLAVCKTNACGHFLPTGVCDDRGGPCTRFHRWLERVLSGSCPHW
jgi:hypothetical protein